MTLGKICNRIGIILPVVSRVVHPFPPIRFRVSINLHCFPWPDKFFSVAFYDSPSSNLAMRYRMTYEIKNTVNSHRVSKNESYYYFISYWNSKPHSSQIDGRWSQPVIFDLSQSRFSLLFLRVRCDYSATQ